MDDQISKQELTDRVNLIEALITEGRRTTQNWGWTFVLWGVVYYLAIGWSAWGHSAWAWPATVSIGVIVTVVIASLKAGNHPATSLGRAIGSIWIAVGVSTFLLFASLALGGRLADLRVFFSVLSAILGVANGASALILRWRMQFACAVVWWVSSVACCFGSETLSTVVFLVAIFLCQIAFGIYGLIAGSQARKRPRPLHASVT